jgi:hypothetical protein
VPVPEQPLLDAPAASTDVVVTADGHQASDDPALGPVTGPEAALASPRRSSTPVLAVLVAHDGGPWLDRTLEALAAQTHEALDVVAVDNGSTDGTRARLQTALGEDAVLVADRDLGFGAAVSMALDARAADASPYVLLLHDDLALTPTRSPSWPGRSTRTHASRSSGPSCWSGRTRGSCRPSVGPSTSPVAPTPASTSTSSTRASATSTGGRCTSRRPG